MAGPEFWIGGISEPTGEQSSRRYEEDHIELKAGWNGPVALKADKTLLFWNRIIFTAMGVLLVPSGVFMLITDDTAFGLLSLALGFLGFFALGAVEFAVRFRKARGATIDLVDIDRESLLHLLDRFLGSKGIEHVPAEENHIILKGTGFEIPGMELRLLAFPMKVTKHIEPGIFGCEHDYKPKNVKVLRLGIRNVDQTNYLHAVRLQIILDGFLVSRGISGIPQFCSRKVGYRWTGRTFESLYG